MESSRSLLPREREFENGIAQVPSKIFITSITIETHRDLLFCKLGNEVCRNHRWIRKWFFVRMDQLWEQRLDIGHDDRWMVVTSYLLRNKERILKLIFCIPSPNRKRVDRSSCSLRHECTHSGGIDAPGEECSHRDIRNHLHAYALINFFSDALRPLLFGVILLLFEVQ